MPLVASVPPQPGAEARAFSRSRCLELPIYRQCDPETSQVRRIYNFLARAVRQSVSQSSALRVSPETKHIREMVQCLAFLEADWDTNGSPPPDAGSIQAAQSFIIALESSTARDRLLPTHVTATAEGGIAYYFKDGDRTAYIEYSNEGETTVVMYEPTGDPIVRELESEDPSEALETVRGYLSHQRT